MASKYKITVTYDDGDTKDFIFSIPAFPGTYHFNVKTECSPNENPDGFITYDPHVIVVGKERKEHLFSINTITDSGSLKKHELRFKTPSLALEDLTWAEIAKISEAGKAKEVFSIGDKKSLGNGLGSAVIIGFDHDDLADGSGKAGITFATDTAISNSTLKSLYPNLSNPTMMNSSNTNSGGWGESRMLNETMGALGSIRPFITFLNKIKIVNKAYVVPNNFPSTCDVETAYSRFFLFSCVEVDEGYSETAGILPYKDEGTIYEYWKTNKPVGRLRTAYPNGTFFRIDAAGAMQQSNASDTAYPIQFGFCI